MVVCVVRLFIVHCYVIGMYYINVCSCISQSVCKVCKSVELILRVFQPATN